MKSGASVIAVLFVCFALARSEYAVSEEQMDWNSAFFYCEDNNGKLVETNSEAAMNDVTAFVETFDPDLANQYWSGLTRQWVWMGSQTPVTYHKWKPLESYNPDHVQEDCVVFEKAGEGTWYSGLIYNDVSCNAIKAYALCEVEAQPENEQDESP